MIKLNLGCGRRILPGFVNIDFEDNYSGMKPDIVADIRKLPFEDKYADEIQAIHVFEHFFFWEALDVLKEWKRVLRPGGGLILELPCLEKILHNFQKPVVDWRLTFWGLYGDPSYKNPHMCHKWVYGIKTIIPLLIDAGFTEIKIADPVFHKVNRDMRVTATRPCS